MIAGRKLLVADDSPAYRKLLDLTFTDEGMEVTTVGDGREAWEKLEQSRPDLVLADVFMPQISGYELCRLIKEDERWGRIPVILVVGLHEPFDEAEARRVGADDVVTKPFQSIRELVSRVGSLLGGKTGAEADPYESAAHEYSTLGLARSNPSPSAAPDEATPEPNVTVFVEAASMPETEEAEPDEAAPEPNVTVFVEAASMPETEAAEPVEPQGSTCPTDIELQTADTMQMERIDLEPASPEIEPIAYAQDDTAEMPAASKTDEREDSSAAPLSSEPAVAIGAPGMSEQASPQFTPAQGASTFDDALLELGDFESTGQRAPTEDVILDLDYEEPTGESRGELASESVPESAVAFETVSAQVTVPKSVPEEAPAYDDPMLAEFQEWAIVTPVETTEAPVEASDAAAEVVVPVAVSAKEQPADDASLSLSPETIDAIARRTVEHLSDRVVREIAWEVVPELAELLIKKKLDEQKS